MFQIFAPGLKQNHQLNLCVRTQCQELIKTLFDMTGWWMDGWMAQLEDV